MAGDYTSQFRTLFNEVQRYVRLQKRYLALDTAEKLVVILSTMAIAVVCFVLGLVVSVRFASPTGASVVCVNIFFLAMFSLLGAVLRKRQSHESAHAC